MLIKERKIYFSTYTVQNWVSVFLDFPCANITIVESLDYLHDKYDVVIYGYVIMRDHLHLVWELKGETKLSEIKISFKAHTGRSINKNVTNKRWRVP